ncbi:hypothetical protein C8Q80DRAFT_1270493 [Daedaleopsis nitida]|nr:hypothetical protein C8Q80DRAFT_1270493 [Daedaleopsis nitida]
MGKRRKLPGWKRSIAPCTFLAQSIWVPTCFDTIAMVPRRHVSPPALKCTQRSSLEAEKCPTVDAILKQLKACSRRLQAALSSHRTELQVLERLYYKGKNQHRTALFWQRVAEMRKLGERVDEMHIDDVVESLRLSFWGEPSSRTAKVLKGPWTHYPDAKVLLFVLERCSACCMLVDRARERFVGAFESFTLMMQTGAFLQLILVLAALASRMSLLLSEVRSALETSWHAGHKVLTALYPSEANSVKMLLIKPDDKAVATTAIVSSTQPKSVVGALPTMTDAHDEDLGDTLARPPLAAIGRKPVAPTPTPDATTLERIDSISHAGAFSLLNELSTASEAQTSHMVATEISIITPASAPKRKKAEENGSKPVKKKKKKRDEIDDIFGF